MAKECSHEEYYGQFVNTLITSVIDRRIGVKAILASDDEHFNDIPLSRWDAAGKEFLGDARRALEAAGDIMSMASLVCIGKAAARIIKKKYWPDQYLHVVNNRTGDSSVMPIADDEEFHLGNLVDKWIAAEFGGELERDSELMESYIGEYYARIMTDGRPPDSVVCWTSCGFNTKMTYE
jgi:hypothetical protein